MLERANKLKCQGTRDNYIAYCSLHQKRFHIDASKLTPMDLTRRPAAFQETRKPGTGEPFKNLFSNIETSRSLTRWLLTEFWSLVPKY